MESKLFEESTEEIIRERIVNHSGEFDMRPTGAPEPPVVARVAVKQRPRMVEEMPAHDESVFHVPNTAPVERPLVFVGFALEAQSECDNTAKALEWAKKSI